MAFKGTVNYIDRFARVKSANTTYNNVTPTLDASLNVTLPKGVYKVEAFLPFVSGNNSGARLDFTFDGSYTNNKSFLQGNLQNNNAYLSATSAALATTTGDTTINNTGFNSMTLSSINVCGVIDVTVKGNAGFKIANSTAGSNVSTYYKGGWVKYTQLA